MGVEVLLSLLFPAALVGVAYLIGWTVERRHLGSLARREAELSDILVTDLKAPGGGPAVTDARMVDGQAVISTDYFKSFASALRNLVGGEMNSLQTLLLRARREATVRMLQEARRLGAREVINVRYETSNIMSRAGNQKAMCAEIYAYGTAIVRAGGDA